MEWQQFWDINKIWFSTAGIVITGFLVFGAIFLAWWINDGFGLVLTLLIAALLGVGGATFFGGDNK